VRDEIRECQGTVTICTPNEQPEGRTLWGKWLGVIVLLDWMLKK